MMKIKLHWQILIALVVAVFAGLFSMQGLLYPETAQSTAMGIDQKWLGFSFKPMYQEFGAIFISALKMIVVPLIAASIITSIAGMGTGRSLGRLGIKTLSFYMFTSLMAILVGLMMVNLVKPGYIGDQPASKIIKIQTSESEKIQKKIESQKTGESPGGFFSRIIPQNILQTASNNGKMLSLIVFCILFAVFMGRLKKSLFETQMGFWQGLYEIMLSMTNFIMKFAPIGVLGLVAGVIAGLNPQDLIAMAGVVSAFFFTVLAALLFHALVVVPLILKFVARVSPIAHFKAMRDALLMAFSTASSAATLPMTLNCVENNAKVSKQTASFVLPLGATVNMDGTALYECVAVIFCVQIFGYDLSMGTQFMIVALALLTSIGVAGIPSASLVAIVVIAQQVDPTGKILAAMAIIYIVDRPLDMLRTSINVLSDSTAAVTVAKLEGETDVLKDVALESPKKAA
ncbi:Proton/glutamate symport protein @ Sodium/glutamate symport protein [hydrothermal vent metagenome]|uniref:Proton/glutamate symport protein @ Sodium/glutamate symport protein n=1 Tax=hydrothermal vent metagenome TaxID=652676 RepID=A0A3B0Z0U4_9ZZZZ